MAWYSNMPSVADILTRSAPVAGATVQIPAGTTLLIIDNATVLALLNIIFPVNPVDGQRIIIATGSALTVLNLSTSDGSTIKGALTSLVANAYARYSYVAASNAWFRTG